MKKNMLTCMVIGMSAAFLFGCGSGEKAPSAVPETSTEAVTEIVTEAAENEEAAEAEGAETQESESTDKETQEAVQAAGETPAKVLLADFMSRIEENPEISMEELANALIEHEMIPFAAAVMPVEPGYLNGFKEEIDGFAEGATFGPMIGTIPFVGYVFRVDGDVDAFKDNLEKQSDLRWNICTQAEEMVCESKGNLVFFVMAPAGFGE